MKKHQGKVMIEKRCKIDFKDMDYMTIKCHKCHGEAQYTSPQPEIKGCPLCKTIWSSAEIEAVRELSNAWYILKEAHDNDKVRFTLSFVSVEHE